MEAGKPESRNYQNGVEKINKSHRNDRFLGSVSVFYSSGSIEIDPIDVSNLRRYCSRRNRIGSNRSKVTKSSVQWEFEYTFFALTLNPMGKRRCLEIEEYAGDTSRIHSPAYAAERNGSIEQKDFFTLQAEFRYLVVFTAGLLSSPRNRREGSRTFNGVYTVITYSNGIMETK